MKSTSYCWDLEPPSRCLVKHLLSTYPFTFLNYSILGFCEGVDQITSAYRERLERAKDGAGILMPEFSGVRAWQGKMN